MARQAVRRPRPGLLPARHQEMLAGIESKTKSSGIDSLTTPQTMFLLSIGAREGRPAVAIADDCLAIADLEAIAIDCESFVNREAMSDRSVLGAKFARPSMVPAGMGKDGTAWKSSSDRGDLRAWITEEFELAATDPSPKVPPRNDGTGAMQ